MIQESPRALLREPKARARDKRAPLRGQVLVQLNSFTSGVTMFSRNRTATSSLEVFLPVILERPGDAVFRPETVTVLCGHKSNVGRHMEGAHCGRDCWVYKFSSFSPWAHGSGTYQPWQPSRALLSSSWWTRSTREVAFFPGNGTPGKALLSESFFFLSFLFLRQTFSG